MNTLYLIGPPGAGKTTLMGEVMRDWNLLSRETKPVKHSWWESPHGITLELGHPRAPFGGTDTLSYTAINTLELWLPNLQKVDLLVGEGDRLANNRFLDLCRSLGTLHLFYLTAPDGVLQDRRAHRAAKNALPPQNPTWAKGRASKHHNLATQQNATILDATQPTPTLAQLIMAELHANP